MARLYNPPSDRGTRCGCQGTDGRGQPSCPGTTATFYTVGNGFKKPTSDHTGKRKRHWGKHAQRQGSGVPYRT